VIDIYFKIKALKTKGIEIILHCFYKDRKPADLLAAICKEVFYYKREINPYLVLDKTPFIVSSRKQPSLFQNTTNDPYPILFEGLHTTYFLKNLKAAGKKCFVRTHNIEHRYYGELAKAEKSLVRRTFFKLEAKKLKKYEPVLGLADGLIAISEGDYEYFKGLNSNTSFIFPFHPEPKSIDTATEKYAFYHGNLEVSENVKAAQFLIDEVMPGLDIKLVVAGKSASRLGPISKGKDVTLIDSPADEEMLKWASGAIVHLLPTFQSTGFKLKLIYSLYTARNIIANRQMVESTGLGQYTHVVSNASEWKEKITSISENQESLPVILRNEKLRNQISNDSLCERLIDFLQ